MREAARGRRVLYVEEPEYGGLSVSLKTREVEPNITVLIPTIPDGLPPSESDQLHASVIEQAISTLGFERYVLWFYSPMPVTVTTGLCPIATVYDCMDDLASFAGAPRSIQQREAALLERTDVVFTGGMSLYEAKRHAHPHVYPFPSSVDVEHFRTAQCRQPDPEDQSIIPHPRLGFFGVIDERIDLELIAEIADGRFDWQIVMLGPIAKIEPSTLPRRGNINYLGAKPYEELPRYVAGWDIALMPFSVNEATRYISPTKTPEYLAAGMTVVSTPIADVIDPYGDLGLVEIALGAAQFIAAVERLLPGPTPEWRERVDQHLKHMSWRATWDTMDELIRSAIQRSSESGAIVAVPD